MRKHRSKARHIFAEQLKTKGINVCGIQEARTHQGVSRIGDLGVCSSGCKSTPAGAPYQGIELWINVVKPLGKGLAPLDCGSLVVTFRDPRLLVARYHSGPLTCTFIVAHAPPADTPESERSDFWDTITFQVEGSPCPIVLIDANARLGSVASEGVGTLGL